MSLMTQILVVSSLSSCLKLLLLPSYKSTDFEVHRNWLAITHNLEYKQWYFENTSRWTLDYPPFFAWFEYGLSQVGQYFDSDGNMLNITAIAKESSSTLHFQCLSVILADTLLYFGVYRCCQMLSMSQSHARVSKIAYEKSEPLIFAILVIFNAGLLMVDHIHFQYNGFLFGFLFLSLSGILQEHIFWGSFWFITLLNFKHIFLYMAPAYGICLLRTHCMDPKKRGLQALLSFSVRRFLSLSAVVITVSAVSFGPFMDHIGQVISRLFPFKRGLTHAYWAPNFWALYNTADKALTMIGSKYGMLSANQTVQSSFSKGLVEETEHIVLPSITPLITVALVLISIMPCLLDMWIWPRSLSYKHQSNQFLRTCVLVSLSSFMFSWHVHEKAILMVILPFTILAVRGTREDAELFILLQVVGHYSLFPLFFTGFETVIKVCLWLLYAIFCFSSFGRLKKRNITEADGFCLPLLNLLETFYVFGFGVCGLYSGFLHRILGFEEKLPFLPLMMTSAYCAVGISWCWIKLYYVVLTDRSGYPIEWSLRAKQKLGSASPERKYFLRSGKRKTS